MRFMTILAGLICLMSGISASASNGWTETSTGLPCYKYEAGSAEVAADPYFLLGNHRVKIAAHASGIYELISGERNWARFNADPESGRYGRNTASVVVDDREIKLVGEGSLGETGKCDVFTGVGFTRYVYDLGEGVECSRTISVMPSQKVGEGEPFFLLTVSFRNTGSSAHKVEFEEAVTPCFVPMNAQQLSAQDRPFRYAMKTDISFRCVSASFLPIPQKFLQMPAPQSRSVYEVAPQSIFLYCDDAFLVVNEGKLKASFDDFRLRPGKTRTFHIVIGLGVEDIKTKAEEFVAKAKDSDFGAFEAQWKNKLSDFSSEKDKVIRREMYRKAHLVEASTVYDGYFKETFIPQGSVDSHGCGEISSNLHHIQAAKQTCAGDPELTKSIIRYVMKQTSFDGLLPAGNKGYGFIPTDSYTDSNLQLEVMNAVAEYLKKTGDYAFIDEWIESYPVERGDLITVRQILELYLLDLIEKDDLSPSRLAVQGAYLPEFVKQMENSGKMTEIYMKELKAYAERSEKVFNEEMENLNFSDVAYILQAPSLSNSVKRILVEAAVDAETADYQVIASFAAFDGIEASSLFRELTLKTADDFLSNDSTTDHIWALYCYSKMME